MAITPNNQPQQGSTSSTSHQTGNTNQNGIATVNDDNNPTPEERDAQIPNEPGTERLRSERQSVQEGKRSE
jgi:hypothetical protein